MKTTRAVYIPSTGRYIAGGQCITGDDATKAELDALIKKGAVVQEPQKKVAPTKRTPAKKPVKK